MHRLTARLLLLLAFAGSLAPSVLAIAAPLRHACCVRAAHHCHELAGADSRLVIRGTSCCNHDCCRAVTTAQWAHAQPPVSIFYAQNVGVHLDPTDPVFLNSGVPDFHSGRAPPSSLS